MKNIKSKIIVLLIAFLTLSIGNVFAFWKFTTSNTQTLHPEKEIGQTIFTKTLEYKTGKITFATDVKNLHVEVSQGKIEPTTEVRPDGVKIEKYHLNTSIAGINGDIQVKFIPNSPTHVWGKDKVPTNLYYNLSVPTEEFVKTGDRGIELFRGQLFFETKINALPLNFDINTGIALIKLKDLESFYTINQDLTIDNTYKMNDYNQLKSFLGGRNISSFKINLIEKLK